MSHFDVDGNETNINAIHEIQAVYIKPDEDIVLKKEIANDVLDKEIDQTNTIAENDNIFDNNEVANDAVDSGDESNSILQSNFTSVPIVYTTRLDEMNIFDKIEKYSPKEAAILIQYESKPQYQQILPIKQEHCGYHSYSFMKLYSGIERLNQKVQTETKLRNEEVMRMCKPLKVVLKDIKYDKAKTTDSESKNFNQTNRKTEGSSPGIKKIQAKPKMTETGLLKSVAKFQKRMAIKINDSDDSDSSDDKPLTMLKPCVINSIHILPGSTTFAFVCKTSMKVDVYIVNYFKDLRCSYETSSEKFNLMKKTSRTKNTVLYDVCCWVKREKQIRLLTQSDIANESAIRFMRKPHGCLPASCTCCCFLEHSMPMQSSVTFLKMSYNKTETKTEASTLIRKAYSCKSKLQSPKICAVDEPVSFLKNVIIMMKYKDIIFSQSYDLGENYEIGLEGDIDNHVKLTVNRSIIEEKELHEKHDRENKICRQYLSYLICCWHKREEIIVNMSKAHNLSPRACKYMRNPHLCRSQKCQCCCKQAEIGLLVDYKNIALSPQAKKHSKFIRENKNKNHVDIDKTRATKIKKIYIDNKKYKGITVTSEKTGAIEGKNKNKQNSVAVLVSHRKPETVQTISQTAVKPSIVSQAVVTKTVEKPTVATEVITNIFDKLRDLKLSVNTNGTLTANINTPPEKLLPVEIKVLADILAQASNQMHELGIEPEEFCRRVNSKSLIINAGPSTGIPNTTIPPNIPFITQPPSLLPQASISPPPLCPISKKTIKNNKDIIKTPQVSKRVKQKSPPCKTNRISINIPRTTNSSKVANLYSMMSLTGWKRNKCMTAAYNIHFDLEMDEEPEPQLSKTQLENIEQQQLPIIVNVQSLVDTPLNTNIKSNRSKRKGMQADKPESKGESRKIRVVSHERVSALPINTLPISTQMNMIGLANLGTLTNNFVKPIEPMPGNSQGNLYNVSLNPTQNVNGDLTSPLPNAGINVLAQGINYGNPMIQIPDSGKIWAFMDGKLVELQCIAPNAAIQNNIALNQNYGTPMTGTINQAPMITVSNGIPMQVSRLCADTEHNKQDVNEATVNVETQESALNSLLRDMLSKESPQPNIPQPTAKHRYSNTLKRPVTPLIQAHSKQLKQKKRKILDDPIIPNPASKENLQNADTKDFIQIIDSDEEEESIFGV